jgi:hypothetical protein
MRYSRGYATAPGASPLAATAPALAALQYDYARILSAKPRRGIFATLRDFFLIAISWTLFIGLIMYPVGHLVGLATCAIALFVLPAERR